MANLINPRLSFLNWKNDFLLSLLPAADDLQASFICAELLNNIQEYRKLNSFLNCLA